MSISFELFHGNLKIRNLNEVSKHRFILIPIYRDNNSCFKGINLVEINLKFPYETKLNVCSVCMCVAHHLGH